MKKLFFIAAAALSMAMTAQAQTVHISTSTDMLALEKVTKATKQVQITRYLLGGYNTVCLPYDITAEQLRTAVGEDVQIERMAAAKAENGTMNLYFLDVTEEGIEAGLPYLIWSPRTQIVTFRHEGNTIQASKPQSISMNGVHMQGTFSRMSPTGSWGIPAVQDNDMLQAMLIRTDGEKNFLPTRCEITTEGAYEQVEIKHITDMSNIETSIETLRVQDAIVDVYTLGGTLVSNGIHMSQLEQKLPRGIYVVAGQKIAIK